MRLITISGPHMMLRNPAPKPCMADHEAPKHQDLNLSLRRGFIPRGMGAPTPPDIKYFPLRFTMVYWEYLILGAWGGLILGEGIIKKTRKSCPES